MTVDTWRIPPPCERPMTQRELEQLEIARGQLEIQKLPIISQAIKAKMYFDALKVEGFTDDQAMEIVKFTMGLLR